MNKKTSLKETDLQDKKLFKKFFLWFWGIFLGLFLLIFLFFIGINADLFGKMPSFEELENPDSFLASDIYSCDGKLIGKYYLENRSNLYYQDLSPYLVEALIATEDARFYDHRY